MESTDDPVLALLEEGSLFEENGDFHQAFQKYYSAVTLGSPSAMTRLALLYETSGSSEESLHFFKEAIKANDPDAMYHMACKYQSGEDVPVDIEQARALYLQATELGHADAAFNLASLETDPAASLNYMRLASKLGNFDATYHLAAEESNERKAFELYLKCANAGHVDAMINVCLAYKNGTGVGKDPVMSLQWLNTAAQAGSTAAQSCLAQVKRGGRSEAGATTADGLSDLVDELVNAGAVMDDATDSVAADMEDATLPEETSSPEAAANGESTRVDDDTRDRDAHVTPEVQIEPAPEQTSLPVSNSPKHTAPKVEAKKPPSPRTTDVAEVVVLVENESGSGNAETSSEQVSKTGNVGAEAKAPTPAKKPPRESASCCVIA